MQKYLNCVRIPPQIPVTTKLLNEKSCGKSVSCEQLSKFFVCVCQPQTDIDVVVSTNLIRTNAIFIFKRASVKGNWTRLEDPTTLETLLLMFQTFTRNTLYAILKFLNSINIHTFWRQNWNFQSEMNIWCKTTRENQLFSVPRWQKPFKVCEGTHVLRGAPKKWK